MVFNLRCVFLILAGVIVALTMGPDLATRAQEKYACPSGKASCYQSGYAGLTEEQEHGRDIKDWYRTAAMQDDFLRDNFLSDGERHPVSEIGTTTERAMASNAAQAHIWREFSSETYKQQPMCASATYSIRYIQS